jgi:hypothetical protein
VDDLVARLQALVRHLVAGGVERLRGARIELDEEVAEQGRRLLDRDRVVVQLDVGPDPRGDPGVAAVDLERRDLADREAGDHDARSDRQAGGVGEPGPDLEAGFTARALADRLPHAVAARDEQDEQHADLDRCREALHGRPPS